MKKPLTLEERLRAFNNEFFSTTQPDGTKLALGEVYSKEEVMKGHQMLKFLFNQFDSIQDEKNEMAGALYQKLMCNVCKGHGTQIPTEGEYGPCSWCRGTGLGKLEGPLIEEFKPITDFYGVLIKT